MQPFYHFYLRLPLQIKTLPKNLPIQPNTNPVIKRPLCNQMTSYLVFRIKIHSKYTYYDNYYKNSLSYQDRSKLVTK